MATASSFHQRHISHSDRRAARHLLAVPAGVFAGVIILAACYITYVLWPRWPSGPVALDAPSIPVTVAGVTFNIPPAAIRQSVQRKPGMQQRVDLAYLWPSLTPPDPSARPAPVSSSNMVDRVFVTIAASVGLYLGVEYYRKEPFLGQFWLWILGSYLTTLALETVLVLRANPTQPANLGPTPTTAQE